jgi:hypothetical protein
MGYYIPAKDAEFVEWSANLIAVSKAHVAEWGLPADQLAEIEALHLKFVGLYELCQTPAHSSLDIKAKNETREVLTAKEQHFVRFHLENNEKLTKEDLWALGLPVHDTTRTPRKPPDSHPVITTSSNNPFEVILHIHDSKTGKRGKPEFVEGAVVFWSVSDTPVTDPDALQHSMLVSRTPHSMTFPAADRGKMLYLAARWQIAKGDKGPPSEVVSAVIP